MGKKIVALLTILAIIFTVAIWTPDSNAGIQTLNLSKQTKEIKVGESFQLTMTGVKASSIKWKSSKPGVATVSKKGVVKGIKAGKTTIKGKYKSLTFSIIVTVSGKNISKSIKTFNNSNTIFELYSPKFEDEQDGTYYMYLGGKFTNNNNEPKSMFEMYVFNVFVNDVSLDYKSVWGYNSVKNGATIESFYGYENLKKGDKVEISLTPAYDNNNILYSNTVIVE